MKYESILRAATYLQRIGACSDVVEAFKAYLSYSHSYKEQTRYFKEDYRTFRGFWLNIAKPLDMVWYVTRMGYQYGSNENKKLAQFFSDSDHSPPGYRNIVIDLYANHKTFPIEAFTCYFFNSQKARDDMYDIYSTIYAILTINDTGKEKLSGVAQEDKSSKAYNYYVAHLSGSRVSDIMNNPFLSQSIKADAKIVMNHLFPYPPIPKKPKIREMLIDSMLSDVSVPASTNKKSSWFQRYLF